MRPSAEHGGAFTPISQSSTGLHRRALASGLLTTGLGLLAAPALARTGAQTAPQTPQVPLPVPPSVLSPEQEEARLLSNLFTRMAVKTELNGRPGFAFVMDTGAGRTAIARDIAEGMGLPPGPSIMVHGLTSAELTPTVKIARLSFGGRRFNDVYAGVYQRELLGADGLMGLDVLARFELEFDMVNRSMRLTPTGPDVIEGGTAFHTASRIQHNSCGRIRTGEFGQLILVNAQVDGVQVDCFVDSGAQYSIGNMALMRAIAPRPDRLTQRALIPVYGVTGQTIMAERADVGMLTIGARRLGPTSLLFADLHAFETLDLSQRPSLLLGADVLYRFRRVSLDFGRSRMDFGPLRRPLETTTRR
jgi:predicted aspartyl protease